MTTKRVARGTLPPIPAVVVEPKPAPRMTSKPPTVTTTTPGVIQKVMPR